MLFPSALLLRLVMAALSLVPRRSSGTANYLRRFATFGSYVDTDRGGVPKIVPLKPAFKSPYTGPYPVCHATNKTGAIAADRSATCTFEGYTSYNTNTTHNYLIADYFIYRQSHKMVDKLDILELASDGFATASGMSKTRPLEARRITQYIPFIARFIPGVVPLPQYALGNGVWNSVNWATSTDSRLGELPVNLTEPCPGSNWLLHSNEFKAFIFPLLITLVTLAPVLGKCLGLSVFVVWSATNGSISVSYRPMMASVYFSFTIYDNEKHHSISDTNIADTATSLPVTAGKSPSLRRVLQSTASRYISRISSMYSLAASILSPGYMIGPDAGSSNASDTIDIPLNAGVLSGPTTPVFSNRSSTAVVLDDSSPTIALRDSQKDSSERSSPSTPTSPLETDNEPLTTVVSHGSMSIQSFASANLSLLSLECITTPAPSRASLMTVKGAFSDCGQCTAPDIYLGFSASCGPGGPGSLSPGELSVLPAGVNDKSLAALAPSSHATTALKGHPSIPTLKMERLELGLRASDIIKESRLGGSTGDAGPSDGVGRYATIEDEIKRATHSVNDSPINDTSIALPSEGPVSAPLPYKKKTRRGCRNRGKGGRGKKVPLISIEAPSGSSVELPRDSPVDSSLTN